MNTDKFTDNISTIQDGKIVIPGEIQKILGVSDGEEVRMVNPALRALRQLQEGMKGAAEEAGWTSDDDVVALVKEVRAELAEERNAGKNEDIYRHKYSDFVHSMA